MNEMRPGQTDNRSNDKYFELKDLSVGYNGKAIIHDINLDIKKGEIVTLIGPNGAGKSTILKTITRQLSRIVGTVTFDDKEIQRFSYKELATRMAVVLTERLHPELMTCFDVVAMGRHPYTNRLGLLEEGDRQIVLEAMKAVRIEDLEDRDFNSISDGQKQRVLLARAIAQEPEIIILDEPTSFLDIRYKLELLAILKEMAYEKGITVIMSLHEIDLAMKISDRLLCIKGDHIYAVGTPEDIMRDEAIQELYEIDNGFFDCRFGSVELPGPKGVPQCFVISSGGSGIPVFRQFVRKGIPFAAGILYRNDTDYAVASKVAAEVVPEEPFMPISDEAFERAAQLIDECPEVICTGVVIGETNKRLRELIERAEKAGKLTEM